MGDQGFVERELVLFNPILMRRTCKFFSGHYVHGLIGHKEQHMQHKNINKEQQARESRGSNNWLMIVWKIITLVVRILNIICSIINWYEGGDN